MPPAPLFYGPLVGTRSFWRLCRIVPVVGYYGAHLRALIWDAFRVGQHNPEASLGEAVTEGD